jgi:hypothetical protein
MTTTVQVLGNGGYQWDSAWEVEAMPDRRCIFDGVLLPNGHVMLLGGQRVRGEGGCMGITLL